jgi:hypothetical protein
MINVYEVVALVANKPGNLRVFFHKVIAGLYPPHVL